MNDWITTMFEEQPLAWSGSFKISSLNIGWVMKCCRHDNARKCPTVVSGWGEMEGGVARPEPGELFTCKFCPKVAIVPAPLYLPHLHVPPLHLLLYTFSFTPAPLHWLLYSAAIHVFEITEPLKLKKLKKTYRMIWFKTEPIKEQQKSAIKKGKFLFV